MNRKLIITATIGLIAMTSACTPAEVNKFLKATRHPAPVVNHRPTVVTPLPRNEATVTISDIGTALPPKISANPQCGESGGPDCPQPATPPTTVYTGPPLMQCGDGSFAPQGECPPTPVEQEPAPTPRSVQCDFGDPGPQQGCDD